MKRYMVRKYIYLIPHIYQPFFCFYPLFPKLRTLLSKWEALIALQSIPDGVMGLMGFDRFFADLDTGFTPQVFIDFPLNI